MLRPSSALDALEMQATNDPKEHARRLALYHATTVGKVWREQPNGEWWLVDLIDGSTGAPVALAATSSLPN